jgi:hypothetical protein
MAGSNSSHFYFGRIAFLTRRVYGCRMRAVTRGLAIAFLVACSGSAVAEVASPDELIAELSHTDFKTRMRSQERLLEWGRNNLDAGIKKFYETYRNSDDPEVRLRSREVLRELVIHKQSGEGEGYLGIRMQAEELMLDGGNLRPVVRITAIMPGTPAAKFELRPNDLIVGIDEVEVGGEDPLTAFGAYVQSRKPRTDVTLHVLRNGQPQDVVVNLMRRPPNLDQRAFLWGGQEIVPPAQEEVEEQEFKKWLNDQRQLERQSD